jgi:large subunit ribosomal protein L30
MIAAIRIRGTTGVRVDIKDTLNSLNLRKKHACVLLADNDVNKGMLHKAKDFITYGDVKEETVALLKDKRDNGKKAFFLHPPRGGYERKGIKTAYTVGGALGLRDNMDDLIQKMV